MDLAFQGTMKYFPRSEQVHHGPVHPGRRNKKGLLMVKKLRHGMLVSNMMTDIPIWQHSMQKHII